MEFIKNKNLKPFYPIFNLSYPIWKEEIIQEFVREDDVFYSNDELFFNEYILNQTFVDCRGNLFKVIDSINIEVKKVFFFKSKRKIMILENTNNKISFQELKDELLKKSETFSVTSVKEEFKKLLDSSENIEQIIKKI